MKNRAKIGQDNSAITLALIQLCSVDELEQALSRRGLFLEFQSELSALRKEKYASRLASLVAQSYGVELLEDLDMRRVLLGASAPQKWVPGSSAAVLRCKENNLPPALAGTARGRALPPVEFRAGHTISRPLFDYQVEVVERAKKVLAKGSTGLISLPTGAGKTRVATQIVSDMFTEEGPGGTIVWLAHTEELCEQAIDALKLALDNDHPNIPRLILRCYGSQGKRLRSGWRFEQLESWEPGTGAQIIVSTPNTMQAVVREGSGSESAVYGALHEVTLIIIDEAHRAGAPEYSKLCSDLRHLAPTSKRIGLSATPVRSTYSMAPMSGSRELKRLFTELIEPIDSLGAGGEAAEILEERGILSRVVAQELSIDDSSPEKFAAFLADQDALCFPSIFFGESVAASRAQAIRFREFGLDSQSVDSETSSEVRHRLAQAMRSGELSVICNYDVLTTGFDAPAVGSLAIFRSTSSYVTQKQMIGRGLRGPALGGNAECKVWTSASAGRALVDPNSLEFVQRVWGE